MEISDTRKTKLKAYCRLDDLDQRENALLDALYDAAVGYMTEAGVEMPVEGTPRGAQYDLCVAALVLQYWDMRGAATTGGAIVDNPVFRQMLNQLKHTEPELVHGSCEE